MKKIIIVSTMIALVLIVPWLLRFDAPHVALGVTFTPSNARYLGLDPHETFKKMLDDLRPAVIRIPAEWDEIEPAQNKFAFQELNWYLNAAKNVREIIVVIGRRTPRWPECHTPAWAATRDEQAQQAAVLNAIQKTITQFKSNKTITMWQVENEPLLADFGVCPPPDENFLQKEIALVKSLDPTRPILITDSGELSTWTRTAHTGDVFATTMYRTVFSRRLQKAFSYWFVPPVFYTAKAVLNKIPLNEFFISELQGEPWVDHRTNATVQVNAADVARNITYARKTGAKKILLWGVEYWYAAAARGDQSYVETLKPIFAAQ